MYQLLIVLYLLALQGSSGSGNEEDVTSHLYPLYLKFEEALVRNTSSLYKLRDVFFSPIWANSMEVQRFEIELCITAIIPPNSSAYENSNNTVMLHNKNKYDFGCRRYVWRDSFLSVLIYVDVLAILGPIYTGLVYNNMVGSIVRKSVQIHLSISSLDSLPTDDDIISASVLLVTWAKAFAKAQGKPLVWNDADRGYVTRDLGFIVAEGFHYKQRNYAHYFCITFITAFVALNIAIPSVLVMLKNRLRVLASLISPTSRSAVIIIATGHNVLYIGFYLCAYFLSHWQFDFVACILGHTHKCRLSPNSQHYRDQVVALVIKGIVTLQVLGVNLVLAALHSKNNMLPMPCSLLRSMNNVSPSKQLLRKVFQTLVIWNLMVAVQIMVGSSLVPIGVLLVVSPLYTLSTFGSMLMVPVVSFICVRLIASSFSGRCSLWRKCKTLCIRIAGCVVCMTLLVVAISLYNLIIVGNTNGGFKGTLLSFLPSILFSVTFWLIRKKLLRKGHAVSPSNRRQQNRYNSMGTDNNSRDESPQVMPLSQREARVEYDDESSDESD